MNDINSDPEGHYHPITRVNREMIDIFTEFGFEVARGPEIEDEWHNFDALNIPENHPARDLWDTFWLKPGSSKKDVGSRTNTDRTQTDADKARTKRGQTQTDADSNHANLRQLLRTHTSPVQIRYMEEHGVPVRIIAPGKVFRNEATDATHEAQFYQIEGLVVGSDITLAHLKHTLTTFFEKLFGAELESRLRPSYFPFVEPGVEMDISCFLCKKEGCRVCKQTGWIEVLGAGMVHPAVLENVGLDAEKWQGFAFGGGTDRFAMLKYGVDDVRQFYTGDLRVISQF